MRTLIIFVFVFHSFVLSALICVCVCACECFVPLLTKLNTVILLTVDRGPAFLLKKKEEKQLNYRVCFMCSNTVQILCLVFFLYSVCLRDIFQKLIYGLKKGVKVVMCVFRPPHVSDRPNAHPPHMWLNAHSKHTFFHRMHFNTWAMPHHHLPIITLSSC